MNVLLVDNFDSFTYNLYQYLGELADTVTVARNDVIPFRRIKDGDFSHIVISPGPGNPTDPAYFGACDRLIRDFYKTYPILGICLGHQGIAAAFGAKVIRAPRIMHGKTSELGHSRRHLFRGIADPVTVMRYHSLAVDATTMPAELVIDASADDGTVMAFHHRDHPLYGLQFHPESFSTETGKKMLKNFLSGRIA